VRCDVCGVTPDDHASDTEMAAEARAEAARAELRRVVHRPTAELPATRS
jgi:hypothetical protein